MEINKSRYSFYQLLAGKDGNSGYEITIPIIQRDYAQGRETGRAEDVREVFLSELITYMSEKGVCHDLDFVYGISETGSKCRKFVPLDGQQRLTTLFLLHWYLSKRISKESEASKKIIDAIQKNSFAFTYETRISSADFCKEFVDKDVDFENLSSEYKNSIRMAFEDASWFSHSWRNDPTVKSMLVMLDAIHNKLSQFDDERCESLLNGLLDEDNPTVTFIFLDLDEYNLSDELYIKMNSRGKQLSAFENFKAKFEQKIKELESVSETSEFEPIQNKIFSDTKYAHLKDVSSYFSFCIDTCWTDMFWQLCKNDTKDPAKKLDQYMSNFIRAILTCEVRDEKENVKYLRTNTELSFSQYQNKNLFSENSVATIIKGFDALRDVNLQTSSILKSVIENGEFTFRNLIVFYLYLQYIIRYPNNEIDSDYWLTFVNKITQDFNRNSPIDSEEDFKNAIENLMLLLKDLDESEFRSIYDLLASKNHSYQVRTYDANQIKEELIKSHLYKREEWRAVILDIEGHHYFIGQIGFLFQLCGIVDYYNENDNCDWSYAKNELYFATFKKYATIASKIFKGGFAREMKYELFERAMIAISPSSYIGITRNNFLTATSDRSSGNIRRDWSWKRYLRYYEDSKYKSIFNDLKKLFDNIDESQPILPELRRVMEENKNEGNRHLVDFEWFSNVCPFGFFHYNYEGNGQFILHQSVTFAQSDVELYTYSFYKCHESHFKTLLGFDNFNCVTQNIREEYQPPHLDLAIKGLSFTMVHIAKRNDVYTIKCDCSETQKEILKSIKFESNIVVNSDDEAVAMIKSIYNVL